MRKKSYPLFKSYLDDGEVIHHVAHRHVLILKMDALKPFFFGIILPLFFYFLFPQFLFIYIIWIFVGVLGVLYEFFDWYYDVWLLTDLGVLDIEKNGLLDVTATRIEYHKVETIAYNIKGWFGTIFQYGDITIDKIGARTLIRLKDASNPKKLERLVIKFQDKFVNQKSFKDHNALKDMLSEMIAYHAQNKKIPGPKIDQ